MCDRGVSGTPSCVWSNKHCGQCSFVGFEQSKEQGLHFQILFGCVNVDACWNAYRASTHLGQHHRSQLLPIYLYSIGDWLTGWPLSSHDGQSISGTLLCKEHTRIARILYHACFCSHLVETHINGVFVVVENGEDSAISKRLVSTKIDAWAGHTSG